MAGGGCDFSKVSQTLNTYKERTETSDFLKLTPFLKCLDACGLSQYKKQVESRCWAPLQNAGKKITIEQCGTVLIDNLAACVIGDKRKLKDKAPVEDPEVQTLANTIRLKLAAKAGEAMVKAVKVDATTARLTDVAGYTGSHKERFGSDGKGKGIDGRKELVDNTGYVGNYKGAGTFDKK